MDFVSFAGVAVSRGVVLGRGEYRGGSERPVQSIVALDGLEIPRKCPLTVEHDETWRGVGTCHTIDLDAEAGLRVYGRMDALMASLWARNRRFGLSAHYRVKESVSCPPGVRLKLNGQWVSAAPDQPLVVVTSARLLDVTVIDLGRQGDSACHARLLTAEDPAVLHAAACGTGYRIKTASSAARIGAATIRAAAGKGKLPTFSGTAYTGAPMKPEGWWQPVIVDLAGAQVPSQHRPALRQHDHEQVVGHTTSVKADRNGIHVEGVLSGERHHVDKVAVPARNGFQWQLSIGANPVRTEYLEAGEEANINGRTVTGPMTIARETEIGEISFVPLGADQETSVHVMAQPSRSAIAAAAALAGSSAPAASSGSLQDWLARYTRPGPCDPTANGYRMGYS